MSRTVRLLVHIPDEVYDNAVKVMENTKTSVEAVLSVATEQAMKAVEKNVRDFLRWHRIAEE